MKTIANEYPEVHSLQHAVEAGEEYFYATVQKGTPRENWLFLKKDDGFANADHDVLAEDASILSGLTIEDLQSARLPGARKRSLLLEPVDVTITS